MRIKDGLPELLAPAGDFDCLVAAVEGGADAVYLGGKSFGARAYAKNFDTDELSRAVAYCHVHGVKLYVTMNTLLLDSEMESAVEFAAQLYTMGVDALIVADLGLVRQLRARVPKMELHASTQMSVHSTAGADAAYRMGCTRVVLARELSSENIRTVTESCLAEVEVFVHGAICVCHSGQCLFSSLVGGRSGNRGECAQPCRLPYNGGGYPLSLSDLSLAGHIKELCDAGVASLKIEGRMKSPDYVYKVTSIYRKLLDEYRNATREENGELERVFSRGGFTDGYFTGDIQSGKMCGVRSEEDKQASRALRPGVYPLSRVGINAKCEMKLGMPSTLTLAVKGTERSVTVLGAVPEAAKNAPLTDADVRARLSKMGNTSFELHSSDVDLVLDEGVNMAPSSINALRRSAAEALERYGYEDRAGFSLLADEDDKYRPVSTEHPRTAIFYDPSVISRVDMGELDYVDLLFIPLWKLSDYDADGFDGVGVALPPVVTDGETEEVLRMLENARECGVRHALVENIGQISLVSELGFTVYGGFRLNVTNRHTISALSELGVRDITLSPELTSPQARRLGGRAVVYGRIPLMLTERCFMKESFGCDRCGKCCLTDRKGVRFPMLREYKHRNLILNSSLTYMGDRESELSGIGGRHLIFTTETPRELTRVLSSFRLGRPLPDGISYRRMGRRDAEKKKASRK